MTCDDAKLHLTALTQGALRENQRAEVEKHLAGCPMCEKELAAAKAVWSSLDMLQEVPTPERLRARISSQIVSLMEAERKAGLGLGKLVAAFLSGIALAVLGVWSLNHQVDLKAFSTLGISSCAILWSGLFVSSFCLILGGHRLGGVSLGPTASVAVASTSMILAGTYFCPKLELLRFWLSSLPGQALATIGGAGLCHFAFGCVYAMVPTFLAAFYFARRLKGPSLKQGLWTAAAFVVLMSPSLYVQCSLMPLALAVLLVAGVFVGSLGGTLTALRLQHRSLLPA